MTTSHLFIFEPGIWVGEGSVLVSVSPERLHFYTRWKIEPVAEDGIRCQQQVEMQDEGSSLINSFRFFNVSEGAFEVDLCNEWVEKAHGKGIVDDKAIAWEFHGDEQIEGFEKYELQPTGDYQLHAEYLSTDQYRTTIEGRIWRKEP